MPNPIVNGQEVLSGDPVSTPPFVDDPDGPKATGADDDAGDIVDPNSPEGSEALQQSFSDSLSDKIDTLTHRIDDLLTLNKVDNLIDTLSEAFQDKSDQTDVRERSMGGGASAPSSGLSEPMSDDDGPEVPDESGPDAEEDDEDTDTDREATAMAKNMRRATDENGTVTDALSADEVLKDVTDQGADFQPAQDQNANEPNSTSAEVGDNYEGSKKTYDDADDDTLKPVATASAMRLADAYIRAGVLRESDRYAAIEGFAKLPKIAAEHELKALDLVRKAGVRKASLRRRANRGMRRAAQFRRADDTQVYDLEGQQTGTITPADDGTFSFDVDGKTGDGYATEAEALDAAKEQTGNDDLVTSTAVASARRRRAAKRRAAKRGSAVRGAARRGTARRGTARKGNARRSSTARRSASGARPAVSGTSRSAAARKAALRRAARKAALRRAARKARLRRSAMAGNAVTARRSTMSGTNAPRRMSAANRARIAARVERARNRRSAKANPMGSASRVALAAARRKAGRTPNIARTAAKADNSLALL